MAEEFTAKLPPTLPTLGLPLPKAGGGRGGGQAAGGGKQKALKARDVITNSSPKRLNSSRRSKPRKTDSVTMARDPQGSLFLAASSLSTSESGTLPHSGPSDFTSRSQSSKERHALKGELCVSLMQRKRGPGPFYLWFWTQLLGFLIAGKLQEKISVCTSAKKTLSTEGKSVCAHVGFLRKAGLCCLT